MEAQTQAWWKKMGFAVLILLVPVLCPMLYSCLVRYEAQSPGWREGRSRRPSQTAKVPLTAVIAAGVVAAMGLLTSSPYLALAGFAGVAAGVCALMWLAQSAFLRVADSI